MFFSEESYFKAGYRKLSPITILAVKEENVLFSVCLLTCRTKKKQTKSLLRLTDLNFKKFWACFSEYLGIKVPVNSALTCPRSFMIFF